ncbi:hypothetical protein J5N97_004599 [Dioscorea zingiberensis]|uniref:glycerophosphodiester phosphodiesterase n=1 Tax=Dioscorea zingiberensis TaxID=325984 RepID=A0A9D5D8N7_9LILI|nr:hypothetical protein J5N97_004599 [Dioscorea zingiberensis]
MCCVWSNLQWILDFTLEEPKSLRVKQWYKLRDQHYNGKYSIITYEEFIAIALDAIRIVEIYPEIKNLVHINQHEIVSIYPALSPPTLTPVASNRVCNALALLQGVFQL